MEIEDGASWASIPARMSYSTAFRFRTHSGRYGCPASSIFNLHPSPPFQFIVTDQRQRLIVTDAVDIYS